MYTYNEWEIQVAGIRTKRLTITHTAISKKKSHQQLFHSPDLCFLHVLVFDMLRERDGKKFIVRIEKTSTAYVIVMYINEKSKLFTSTAWTVSNSKHIVLIFKKS